MAVDFHVTERACREIRRQREKSRQPEHGLRIAFVGGCGGLGFRMYFVPAPVAGDSSLVLDAAGTALYLDPKSISDLSGAKLDYDYSEEEQEYTWILDHPNAVIAAMCN